MAAYDEISDLRNPMGKMFKDRAILYLAIAQTLTWAGSFYVFPALLVRWQQDLGWSIPDLTIAITLAICMSAITSPLAGRLIDHGRGPVMMALCTFVGGICLAMLSQVTEIWQFYSVWAIIGTVMAGSLYEPCFALITRARGAAAKRDIILITLVAGFAGTISFPAAHALSDAFDWRTTVSIFAVVVILIAAPLMYVGAREVERSGKTRSHLGTENTGRNRFLHTPLFWFLAFGFGMMAIIHGVTLHHLLPIMNDRDVHPDVAVMAASFIGPMQVAGRLAMMASEKHISNHGMALGCFSVMGGSILFLIASGSAPMMLVGFVILFGGANGVMSIVRPTTTRELLGEENFGAKSGALALFFLAGSASAPFLGSVIWEVGGYDLVLQSLIVVAGLAISFYLVANFLHRKNQPN